MSCCLCHQLLRPANRNLRLTPKNRVVQERRIMKNFFVSPSFFSFILHNLIMISGPERRRLVPKVLKKQWGFLDGASEREDVVSKRRPARNPQAQTPCHHQETKDTVTLQRLESCDQQLLRMMLQRIVGKPTINIPMIATVPIHTGSRLQGIQRYTFICFLSLWIT